MRSVLFGVVTASALVLSQRVPPPQDPAPKADPAQQLAQLAWISGTWVLEEKGVTTEEHWRPLQGTMLLGTSHTFDRERTRFFEQLRIAVQGDQLAYIASPGGGPSTAFVLSKLGADAVEFENKQHDHPQRIRYEKTAAGITATISQLDGSRAMAYVYKKRG
jgi:hypothetical protein